MFVRVLPLLLVLATGACAARGGVPRPFPGASLPPSATVPAVDPRVSPAPAGAIDSLIQTALGLTGVPYRNGGSTPAGFDCSGFVQYVFAQVGRALPREVRDQFQIGEEIDLDEVRPGDLLFFETVSRGASHVGVALGDGRFVHAPSSRGVVRIEPYTGGYWSRRFVGARRLLRGAGS